MDAQTENFRDLPIHSFFRPLIVSKDGRPLREALKEEAASFTPSGRDMNVQHQSHIITVEEEEASEALEQDSDEGDPLPHIRGHHVEAIVNILRSSDPRLYHHHDRAKAICIALELIRRRDELNDIEWAKLGLEPCR